MQQDKEKRIVDLQDFVPQRSSIPKQVPKHPSLWEGLGGSAPRWATADAQAYTTVENNAIKNRKVMTVAEQTLWEQLRSNKLGARFRRQHVIEDRPLVSRQSGVARQRDLWRLSEVLREDV